MVLGLENGDLLGNLEILRGKMVILWHLVEFDGKKMSGKPNNTSKLVNPI